MLFTELNWTEQVILCVSWVRQKNDHLIAYFHSKMSSKNYQIHLSRSYSNLASQKRVSVVF